MSGQARYAIIPTAALEDSDLSAQDIRILAALGSYLSSSNEGWPRQSTIAERAFCTRETVNRTLKRLIEKGYVEASVRSTSGMKRSNRYRVILDVIPESQRCDPSVTTDVIPGDHNRCDPATSQQEEETHKKKPIEDHGTKEVFEFYNSTAKRVGWIVHSKLTDALKHPLNARIEEHGAEKVMQFIEALSQLDWTWNGFNGNGFRASLTYVTRPRTFAEQFDKLVTSAPLPLLAASPAQKPVSDLFHAFSVLADHGQWLGDRYGFPTDPRHPSATYPEELYTQFKITKREAA